MNPYVPRVPGRSLSGLWRTRAATVLMTMALAVSTGAVEFPGPVTLPQDGASLSALGVRLPLAGADDFVSGGSGGFLALNRYNSASSSFTILHRLFVGSEVRAIIPWPGRPLSEPGLVVAAANPDRVVFLDVEPNFPHLRIVAEVPLDEDPGELGFVGNAVSGPWELAVTLPGMDRIALVTGAGASWSLAATIPAGDRPASLAAVDLDGDGSLEAVVAQAGALSGSLGVLRRQPDGSYALSETVLPGVVPQLVRAADTDGDGWEELLVAGAGPEVVVYQEVSGSLVEVERIELTAPAQALRPRTMPGGEPGVFTANYERGLLEYSVRAAGTWTRRDILYPGCRPQDLAFADVDGNPGEDLITVGGDTGVLTIMLSDGQAGFAGIRALSLSESPGAFTYSDLDADGRADLLIADANRTTVRLFRAMPSGALGLEAEVWDLGFIPGRISAVDMAGDPRPELVVLDIIAAAVVVFELDPSTGPRELSRTPVGSFPFFLAAADLDADGFGDLLVLTQGAPGVVALFGDGTGGVAATTSFGFDISPDWIVALDLDADGDLDVAATDGLNRVWTRRNDGARAFIEPAFVNAGAGALHLDTGDLDGDGDDDLVVANRSEQSLSFFENNGSGGLVRRIGAHVLPGQPAGLVLQDFDGDGRSDVLVNLQFSGALSLVFGVEDWVYSLPSEFAGGPDMTGIDVADFNLDGVPDILALDRSLLLGLALINTDPGQVAVEPTALVAECREDGWRFLVRPDRPGPWRLELGRGAGWKTLAADGRAALGRLEWSGDRWLLDLPAAAAAGLVPDGGAEWQVRLTVGSGEDRETAVWSLDEACTPDRGILPPRLAWGTRPWPNPFNPRVHARFRLAAAGHVDAAVYDVSGRRVASLLDRTLSAGDHDLTWDGRTGRRPAAAGLYLLRIATPGGVLQEKLVLVK